MADGIRAGDPMSVALDEVIEVIRETFAAKPAVIDVNIEALRKGYELGVDAKQLESVEA